MAVMGIPRRKFKIHLLEFLDGTAQLLPCYDRLRQRGLRQDS